MHGDDRFDGGFNTLLRTRLGHLIPSLALRVGEKFGAAGANLIGDAHILGMVRDSDPVQRPVLFEADAIVHDDFAASGNSEEVIGGQRYPEHARVEGVAGVDVGDAPVHPGRKRLSHIGGVLPASDHRRRGWLGRFLWRRRSVSDAGEFAVLCIS